MGVYQALAEHGLGVPDDVAVVSFDGSELADWLRPRLASVALPFEAMGRRAVGDPARPDLRRAAPRARCRCGSSPAARCPIGSPSREG